MTEEHPLRPPFHWDIRSDSMQGLTSKSKEIRTMTKEEILAMQPGSELNTLIAERVLNWYVSEGEYSGKKYWNNENDYSPYAVADFKPSTDISAAWEVVEKMRERIFSKRRVFLDNLQELTRYIGTIDRTVAWPDVFWFVNPESICKAALLAVMEGKDKEE